MTRYYAFRPVVHCRKDGASLAYVNHEAVIRWYEIEKSVLKIREIPDVDERLHAVAGLARSLEADFLTTDFPIANKMVVRVGLELVDQRQFERKQPIVFSLFKVIPETGKRPTGSDL